MAEHVYPPAERPDVEVEVDGTWYPGELRGWWDRPDDTGTVRRLMNVSWRSSAGTTFLDTFPADRVREVPDAH